MKEKEYKEDMKKYHQLYFMVICAKDYAPEGKFLQVIHLMKFHNNTSFYAFGLSLLVI